MIQRIQTVFFLIATILYGLMFVFPLNTRISTQEGSTGFEKIEMDIYKLKFYKEADIPVVTEFPIIAITALVGFIALSCFGVMFLFKNRTLQARFTKFLILASIMLIISIAMYIYRSETGDQQFFSNPITQRDYHAGIFFPFFGTAFLILAYRGVNKDEELVRSADRIR